ncbi:MAG: hypothetical protein Q4C11_01425 [Clostridium sp.]|nr:hypothetical protein [Clostridium sp.]
MVVTIVVLLILAGVSISLILDNNGIIQKSKDARREYRQSQTNEQSDLDSVSEWLDDVVSGKGKKLTGEEYTTEYTKPYLPGSDFYVLEGTTLANGLVVRDGAGNEYVWVEVPTSIYDNETYNTETEAGDKKPANKEETDKIEYCLKNYTSKYRTDGFSDEYMKDSTQGWFADKTAYDNAKNAMLKSVYENGGFYVGRYEAGISESRTSKETELTATPLSQQNMFPYTYITRTQAKQLAEKVNSGGYTSSLMFGIQWDLMLAHIQNKGGVDVTTLTNDSTNIGNYYNNKWNVTNDKAKYNEDGTEWKNCPYQKTTETGILLTTGASETFAKMNIYDVAGNVFEWTLEGNQNATVVSSTGIRLASLINSKVSPIRMAFTLASAPCVNRGGGYNNDGSDSPASDRDYLKVEFSNDGIGFRVTLY